MALPLTGLLVLLTPFECQDQIVGRHRRKLEQLKLAAVRESGHPRSNTEPHRP